MTLLVYKAINAVQAEISKTGISKDRQATGFGAGYKFRGIDDVYSAISPLLAKHGLVILPRCLERTVIEKPTKGGTMMFYVAVRCEFDFVSAEDGSKHTACTYGEAMDSGDKATNKAMSIAYKYACFQVFAIPTEGDNDPDATVHPPVLTPHEACQQDLLTAFADMAKTNSLDELKRIYNWAHKQAKDFPDLQEDAAKQKDKNKARIEKLGQIVEGSAVEIKQGARAS
ncbi:MAG: ERF family protein [Pseudomonadota bacterium]|nr:ERF family protein [Pseudomonadota bacterium]